MLQSKKEKIINNLKKDILKIREEIGLTPTQFEIVDINIDGKILTIYTKNRTDKSIIIGPGGWVVGKLREKLKDKFNIIRVEDYSDILLFRERVKLIKSFFSDKEIQIICDYFLSDNVLKTDNKVVCIVQCQYDLYSLSILSKIFNVKAITYDFPALVPKRTKNKITTFINENNIDHEFISLNISKEELTDIIKNFPYGFLKDKIIDDFEGVIFTSCLNCRIFKHKKGILINFFKLFPLKMRKDEKYLNYCPLCIQSCKFRQNSERFIKKIVEEVYVGFKEPTDATEEILSMVKTWKR
ncbi:conserved hypothetical protein [Methanocaldococcus vulcanius M7]|uniref:Uncharacterized protein n=1 Tax=Methanocaldococcus vulcanius (strain ATCC 700851 / DSM 12094 / M7) TaxID=579137 RepID=C9REI4_METVM|nr:conserved hypothetical protein [Methanocaldococcus vulcanius M7]